MNDRRRKCMIVLSISGQQPAPFPPSPHLMCSSHAARRLEQPQHGLFVLFWIKSTGLLTNQTNRDPYVPMWLPNTGPLSNRGTDDEDHWGSIKHVNNVRREGRHRMTDRQQLGFRVSIWMLGVALESPTDLHPSVASSFHRYDITLHAYSQCGQIPNVQSQWPHNIL